MLLEVPERSVTRGQTLPHSPEEKQENEPEQEQEQVEQLQQAINEPEQEHDRVEQLQQSIASRRQYLSQSLGGFRFRLTLPMRLILQGSLP